MKVEYIQYKDILPLGKKIVDELGLDESSDTLGRWMAHYIAELIQSAEAALEDDRPEKLARCAEAILGIWEHRSMLPNDKRPFEDFEPILRVLESLDIHNNIPRYFRLRGTTFENDKQQSEIEQWLDTMRKIDSSAKSLISYCLAHAAENAKNKSKEWMHLAEVFSGEEIDFRIMRLIPDKNARSNASILDELERRQAEDQLLQLESLMNIASALSSELREKLERLDNTDAMV